MTFGPDNRLYVWEKPGRVWIVTSAGERLPTPLIDISEEVGNWRDHGLLGFALDPNFYSSGHIYLFYVVDHHHLAHFGTPAYDPQADEYFTATIGRITRYTANAADGFSSVDPTSRLVLVGESATTGFPVLNLGHGVCQLVFGTDGTLFAGFGDGASFLALDNGGPNDGYVVGALAEGILTPEEDVGAFRAQQIDSLCGKIVRLDPATGDGLPSNPYFDPSNPRASASRVWAVGLRNPYRMSLRPGTGSHNAGDGAPGVLYIGDVGAKKWEEIDVCAQPGQNFGWPCFEGLEPHRQYEELLTANPRAPNPLFGKGDLGQGPCSQEFFYFQNLIAQEREDGSYTFPNPCDSLHTVPSEIPTWSHSRPIIEWIQGLNARTRVPSFAQGLAVEVDIDSPASPVVGEPFFGDCSIGGAWYSGSDYPDEYKDLYYFADYVRGWIRGLRLDEQDTLLSVHEFLAPEVDRSIVHLTTPPLGGGLYYMQYGAGNEIRRITFQDSSNLPPVALASSGIPYGPSPLSVSFDGGRSADPEGSSIDFLWDFGLAEGSCGERFSTQVNPQKEFSAPSGNPTSFQVTLTITDEVGLESEEQILISVNNSPPSVSILEPANNSRYPLTGTTAYALEALITDREHGPGELSCAWQTILHHNDHTHPEPLDESCSSTTLISPVGCDGEAYFYEIVLTVTDGAGLSATARSFLFPECGNLPPAAFDDEVELAQGFSMAIDVLANDYDLDGSIVPSSLVLVSEPLNGAAMLDPSSGQVLYSHDPDSQTREDHFTYLVADDQGEVSSLATVHIDLFNHPPSVEMLSPPEHATYEVGMPIVLAAQGFDLEDGQDLDYQWRIDRIHNAQVETSVFMADGPLPPDFMVPPYGKPEDRISYRIQLTATDRAGATAVAVRAVVPISPPDGNAEPIARIQADRIEGRTPLTVDFDASLSTDPDGDHLLYSWNLGDGVVEQGASVRHTFTRCGLHQVTLTALDPGGAVGTARKTLFVRVTNFRARQEQ